MLKNIRTAAIAGTTALAVSASALTAPALAQPVDFFGNPTVVEQPNLGPAETTRTVEPSTITIAVPAQAGETVKVTGEVAPGKSLNLTVSPEGTITFEQYLNEGQNYDFTLTLADQRSANVVVSLGGGEVQVKGATGSDITWQNSPVTVETKAVVIVPLKESGKPRFEGRAGEEVSVIVNGHQQTAQIFDNGENKGAIEILVPTHLINADATQMISVNDKNVPQGKQHEYCVNFGPLENASQPVKLDAKRCSPAKEVGANDCKKEKTTAAVIGVLGLITALASFLPIPGLKDAITNLQKTMGIHNPELAGMAEKALPALGGLVGLTSLITAIALPAKCAAENGAAANPGHTNPEANESSSSSMPIK